MQPSEYLVSRPAKVKLRNSDDVEEGFIVFISSKSATRINTTAASKFSFQGYGKPKTEKEFDFWNVDIITFL